MDARIIAKSEHLIRLFADLPVYGGYIRIACDDKSKIEPCKAVVDKVLARNPKKNFFVYCILTADQEDSFNRVNVWREYGHKVCIYAPPYRDFSNPKQVIPRWQKDMARWANNRFLYYSCDFKDYKKVGE